MTDAQSARQKKSFLERFAVLGNVTGVCRELGIGRRTVYDWKDTDEDFAKAFTEAEEEATETLETEARRRAVDGVTKHKPVYYRDELLTTIVETEYSDTLLIFLLKARAPEKYRDNSKVEHTGGLDIRAVGDLLQLRDTSAG